MSDEELTPTQTWRRHKLRQILLFVTVPGVLVGAGTFTAAYAAGWMTPAPPPRACSPVVVPAPARASFAVNILNATGRDGVAGTVAAGLAKRKFAVGTISNAPDTWYVTDSAVIHHGKAGLDQALLVASQIPGSKLFEDTRSGSSVDVVVGLAYTALTPIPARFKPYPSEVRVNVYNTTYKTGLAKTVADQLKARGFVIKDVSNDPLRTLQMGTAIIRYGDDGDLAAALVQEHVPRAQLVKDSRSGTSVDLVIGNAYSALTDPANVPPLAPRPKLVAPTVARPCQ